MTILVLITVLVSLRASVGLVTGAECTLVLQGEEILGTGLPEIKGAEKPFLCKFSDIQYDISSDGKSGASTEENQPRVEGQYLNLFVSKKTRKHFLPIVIFFGGLDIADICKSYCSEEMCDETVFIYVPSIKSPLEETHDIVSENGLRSKNAFENAQRIRSAALWAHQNAHQFGGDKSRTTLVGFGKEASLAVSLASSREENCKLFYRAVVEFGEHSFFGASELLHILLDTAAEKKISPPGKDLLIGYDSSTVDLQHVTSVVDFVEAFANAGSRVTLLDRKHGGGKDASMRISFFKLFVQFASKINLDNGSLFPQLKLGNWRKGLEIVHVDEEKWKTATRSNLFEFEPRAVAEVADPFPVVTTTLGVLRGRHLRRGDYEADAFYHIPYASETKRFDYSEMVEPWDDLLDARYPVRYKDCPQNVFVNFGHEDCLNLIVFVPQTLNETLSGDRLPVMVFMHGGSYAVGTAGGFRIPGPFDNSLYDGTVMADFAKVIVVSVNYRLAALGFLNDGDVSNGILDGNYGTRDMVLALQWVQKHIGEFGGDPDLVTLFGESAGASGTGLLGLSPMTKGLIKRHIQESGSPVSFFAVDFNPSILATEIFTELGCRSENLTATKECLMLRGEFDFIGLTSPHPYVPWRPTIDGVFLTEDPAITAAKPTELDLIVGHNYDELYIIAATVVPKLLTDLPLTMADLKAIKSAMDIVLLEYPDRQQYISDVAFHSSLGWEMDLTTEAMKIALVRASSDYVFAAPSVRQAQIRSQNVNGSTYMYSFEIKTKLGIVADWSTNSHAFELPYVFGQGLRRTENGPVYNATQDKLSLQMISYWTNFAKTGDPNSPMTDEIDGNIWEAYDEVTKRYMALNFRMTPDSLKSDYRSYQIQLWNNLVPLLLQQDREACSGKMLKTESNKKVVRSGKALKRKVTNKRISATIPFGPKTIRTLRENCDLTENLVRNTTVGCVRGILSDDGGLAVEMYLGVPYAKPPTGELRFSPTQRVETWGKAVLNADDFMPDCPRNSTLEGQSEDCLYLNIYRPNSEDTLPVMVWIHSDPYEGSGGRLYDGKRIAVVGNVVVVTFNYRIGVFGFLAAGGDTDAAGNQALLDQNAALLWVKDNIENFGGLSSKITLFGDGDSSKFVGYHTVTTVNSGASLFSNVIHQSGVGQFDDAVPVDDVKWTENLATRLGCVLDTTEEMLSCMRTKTTEEIMQNSDLFEPKVVVDGIFLRDQPTALFEQSVQRLNYLIGFTTGEGSSEYESVVATVNDRSTFAQYIEDNVILDSEFENADRVKAVVEYEYTDFGAESGTLAQKFQNAAMNMFGDKYIVAPSMMLANRTSAISRFVTRTYVCKLTSPADDEYPEWVGAPSGSFEKLFWRHFELDDDSSESALSDRIIKYWTTFAKNGRPFGIHSDDSWKRYKTDVGEYGELEAQSNFSLVRNFPRPKYTTLWNSLIPSIDMKFPCDVPPPPENPEVVASNGVKIRGYSETTSDGRNYDVFRGLPYAPPPTGDKRFAASEFEEVIPQNPPGSGILHATIKKPKCLQTANGARGGFASEDCLYLDIWRSKNVSTKNPVMFWICNGGYSVGGPHSQLGDDDSCDVDGQLMALDGDIVFVKVQYRVGVMGFLSSGDSTLPGNAGLSDLKNALRWVYRNIGDFGGNKDQVTLAGNGFGGTLAMVLGGMSDDMQGGAVQSVIAQSGSLTSPWAYGTHPEADLLELAIRTGCDLPLQTNVISCLRGLDALQVITTAGSVNTNFPFGIYADDTNVKTLTKESFLDLIVNGSTVRSIGEFLFTMPTLIGLNGGAGYHYTLEAYPEMRLLYGRRPIKPDLIQTMIRDDVYLDNFGLSWNETSGGILEEFYIPWGQTDSRNEIRRSAVQYHTDEGFLIPIYDEINTRLSETRPEAAYLYVYQEATDARRARWQTAGADLGEEIPVLFKEGLGDKKAALGATMRSYWTSFVNTGRPDGPLGAERWRRYTVDDKSTMIFNTSGVRQVCGYRDQALKIWQEVFASPEDNEGTTLPCPTSKTTPMTCPTVACPTCSAVNEPCASDPIMGKGIGLELTPSQADVAIEALFGISLSFACIIVLAIAFYLTKLRKTKSKSKPDLDLVVANGNAKSENEKPPQYQEFSAL